MNLENSKSNEYRNLSVLKVNRKFHMEMQRVIGIVKNAYEKLSKVWNRKKLLDTKKSVSEML